MQVGEALRVLGLAPAGEAPTWGQIRAAYRRLLRAHHPDLSDTPGAAERTARLNVAYATLEGATEGGKLPLARPAPPSAAAAGPGGRTARPRPEPAGTKARPGGGRSQARSGATGTETHSASGSRRPGAASARTDGPSPASASAVAPTMAGAGRHSPEKVFRRLRAAASAVGAVSGVDPETLTLQILVEAPGAAPGQLLAEVGRRHDGEITIMFTFESLTSAPAPPIKPVVERLLARLAGTG